MQLNSCPFGAAIAPAGARCEAGAMIAMLLAAALAADPPAAAGTIPDSVTIGETVQDGWRLKAETIVQHNGDGLPTIYAMRCDATRNGLAVRTFRDGGVSIEIKGGVPDEEGDDFGFTNVERLELDGQVYEARWGERGLPWEFTDVDYPKQPPRQELPPGMLDAPIPVMEAAGGFLAVRRPGEAQWHDVGMLADEVTRARRLRIIFRGSFWYHDAHEPLHELAVPLGRLGAAPAWCRAAMGSERALRLHPERAEPRGAKP